MIECCAPILRVTRNTDGTMQLTLDEACRCSPTDTQKRLARHSDATEPQPLDGSVRS
jgi:hypothetical protein